MTKADLIRPGRIMNLDEAEIRRDFRELAALVNTRSVCRDCGIVEFGTAQPDDYVCPDCRSKLQEEMDLGWDEAEEVWKVPT